MMITTVYWMLPMHFHLMRVNSLTLTLMELGITLTPTTTEMVFLMHRMRFH